MDQLSASVWLRILNYLDTTDILYSLSNVNSQLEELIIPYQQDINLSDISFQSLNRFVHYVLPHCHDNIRSLTIKNNYQIEYCICNNLFRSLSNLQSLRIKTDLGKKIMLSSVFFSKHFRYLIKLTRFDLYNVSISVNDFASYMPLSLTHLNLGNADRGLAAMHIERLRNLKILKTYLRNLNELCVIESLNNLRELYLCLLDSDDFNDVQKFSMPKSLVKLHLEYRESTEKTNSSLKILTIMLPVFKKHLRSLTLIIDSRANEYADFEKIDQLQQWFSRLTSFEYLIHTPHSPSRGFDQIKKLPNNTYLIYTMKPRRPINYFEIFKYDCSESVSSVGWPTERLYFTRTLDSKNLTAIFPSENVTIGCRLPNLRYFSHNMLMRSNIDDILRLFLWSATNLNYIQLNGESAKEILHFLKYVPNSREKIVHFQCSCSQPLSTAFFFTLSRHLPSLKHFYLMNVPFFEEPTCNNQWQTSRSLIDAIRKYFHNVILVEFSISIHESYSMEKSEEYKNVILWLNQHSEKLFYVDHLIDKELKTHLISIWL